MIGFLEVGLEDVLRLDLDDAVEVAWDEVLRAVLEVVMDRDLEVGLGVSKVCALTCDAAHIQIENTAKIADRRYSSRVIPPYLCGSVFFSGQTTNVPRTS